MPPEFVEFTGKKDEHGQTKPYKCYKCKKPIKYAKFFGPDKKVLTTDGKEPYFDRDKKPMSNTGWPTDPLTKQIHECEGDNSGNTLEIKTKVVHNSQTLLEVLLANATDDEKSDIKRLFEESRKTAIQKLAKYVGVLSACESVEKLDNAFVGMISNQVNEDWIVNVVMRNLGIM